MSGKYLKKLKEGVKILCRNEAVKAHFIDKLLYELPTREMGKTKWAPTIKPFQALSIKQIGFTCNDPGHSFEIFINCKHFEDLVQVLKDIDGIEALIIEFKKDIENHGEAAILFSIFA